MTKPAFANSNIVVTIVAVLVVIGSVSYAYRKSAQTQKAASSPSPSVSATETASASPAVGAQAITISSYAYGPASLTVHVGDTVTWTNQDPMAHTVTSTGDTTLDSGNLDQGQSYSFTFTKAGTYAYHCIYHSFMTGTVIVQ